MNVDGSVRGVVLAGSASWFFSFFFSDTSEVRHCANAKNKQLLFLLPSITSHSGNRTSVFLWGFAFLHSALTSISSRWACDLSLTNQIISVPWQQ